MIELVTVKDLGEIITGNTPPRSKPELYGKHTPFIKATDISENEKFTINPEECCSEEGYQKYKNSLIPKGATCVVTIGSVGKKMTMAYADCFINQAINAIIPNENFDEEYVYYLLKNNIHKLKMLNSGTASGRENVSKSAFSNMELLAINDRAIQNRIGKVLSTYDNLIANNQKQIKLLEEAAQRLYKEWFVDLRFPGYEDTKTVDGVPEGWDKTSLPMIAPIVTGKKDANFGAENGEYLFFTCAQEPINAPSYSFDCDAVILAGNGDFNVKLYRGQFEAYQRTYVFSPYDSKKLFLLYFAVKDNMRQLFQGASGSTIKFLTKRMLEEIVVYVPAEDVLTKFNNYCEANQKKLEASKRQIKIAQESRDRLLPRLMSGELEV